MLPNFTIMQGKGNTVNSGKYALLNVHPPPPLNIRPPKLPFEKLNAQGVLSGVYGIFVSQQTQKL